MFSLNDGDESLFSCGKPAIQNHRLSAAWVLALFAVDPTFGFWSLAWMFPLGLARIVLPPGTDNSGWTIFGACVGVYIVQAVFFFRSKNMGWTILWFAILIILLIGNVAGCRAMIHGH